MTVCVIRQVLHERRHTHSLFTCLSSCSSPGFSSSFKKNPTCTKYCSFFVSHTSQCILNGWFWPHRLTIVHVINYGFVVIVFDRFSFQAASLLESGFLYCLFSLEPTDSFELLTVCSTFASCCWNVFGILNGNVIKALFLKRIWVVFQLQLGRLREGIVCDTNGNKSKYSLRHDLLLHYVSWPIALGNFLDQFRCTD